MPYILKLYAHLCFVKCLLGSCGGLLVPMVYEYIRKDSTFAEYQRSFAVEVEFPDCQ